MKLVSSTYEELALLAKMAKQKHISDFLSVKSLEEHQAEFEIENREFLNIITANGSLAGYCILLWERAESRVQLKRMVVDESYLGLGQEALLAIENYCAVAYVWLDVYADNKRAIHVYEKLGYRVFKKGIEKGRDILFYALLTITCVMPKRLKR